MVLLSIYKFNILWIRQWFLVVVIGGGYSCGNGGGSSFGGGSGDDGVYAYVCIRTTSLVGVSSLLPS